MSKARNTGNLNNSIQISDTGNITFVSGSTTLLAISSSGAVTTTGVISGSNALSASFAATASSADNFLARGTITAQTLVVQTITSSVDWVTGSAKFGSINSNAHQFTGSVAISGSSTFGLDVNAGTLYVSANGNVGVGTTSPNMKLDVSGSGLGGGIRSMGASGASGGKGVEIGYELGDFGTVLAYDRTGGVFKQLRINDLIHAGIGSTGNVGIGTTNPSAKLDVSGSVTVSGSLSIYGDGAFINRLSSGEPYIFFRKDGVNRGSIYGVAGGGIRIFDNNDVQVLTITSSFVGIGTSVPGQTLEIRSANGQGIRFKNSGSSDKRWDIVGSGNDLRVNETGVGAVMTFEAGGNIGIGTTDPGYKLDVYTAGATSAIRVNSDTSQNSQLRLEENSAVKFAITYVPSDSSTRFFFAGVGTDLIILKGNNVGIGITNPDSRLTVTSATAGPYGTGTPDIAVGGNIGGSTTALQIYRTATTGGNIGIDAFRAGVSGASLLLNAANSGNVGVGTTNPLCLLQAGGIGNSTVRLGTSSTTNTSTSSAFAAWNSSGQDLLTVRGDGLVAFAKINDFTTGNSPNTWINPASSYGIYINTSSIRYKRDIINYDKGLSIVSQLRPVYYKGKSEIDGDKQFAGFIAEEIDALGLTEFVNYLEDGRPNSLSYPNMVALLTKAIQELKSENDSLKEILQRNNIV